MINSLPTAQKEKITLVDMYSALGDYYYNHSNSNFTYQSGSSLHNAHPNTNGYQVLANTWFNAIQNYYQPALALPGDEVRKPGS